MKEATGELNMTVITVVAIAAVAAFFYAFVWPNIKNQINRSQYCSQAQNCYNCDGKNCTCDYCKDADCNEMGTVKCPDKGTGDTGTTTTTTS